MHPAEAVNSIQYACIQYHLPYDPRNYVFDCTHSAMPPRTNTIPIHVSGLFRQPVPGHTHPSPSISHVPLEMTFPSVYHSPNTVNKNAKLFVIGTVKLNSSRFAQY